MTMSGPAECPPPFTDQGGPQSYAANGLTGSPVPVGNTIQYMWNASVHAADTNAADLTVWVRRDSSAPVFVFHAIRYQYPAVTDLGTGGTPTAPSTTPPP